jgi:hypothetical protein
MKWMWMAVSITIIKRMRLILEYWGSLARASFVPLVININVFYYSSFDWYLESHDTLSLQFEVR